MILLRCPADLEPEIRWLGGIVFDEFIGVEFGLEATDGEELHIEASGSTGRLTMSLEALLAARRAWLQDGSAPAFRPRPATDFGRDHVLQPVIGADIPIAGRDAEGPVVDRSPERIRVAADLFGTIFFLQSRYEECVVDLRDHRDRFTSAGCGHKEWLHRPVADELKWVVYALMKELWPNLPEPPRPFRIMPSHDVDLPSIYDAGRVLRKCLGLVRQGCITAAITSLVGLPWGARATDAYDTVSWLMDASEKRGLTSAFYYIPEQTDTRYDPKVDLSSVRVRAQWLEIAQRGHELGIHPGYQTYLSRERIISGVRALREAVEQAGVAAEIKGGRQHFLRWRYPETIRHWEAAGLDYDASMGFAEISGFRCGTCREFQTYDVVERRPHAVRERPLIVMDASLVAAAYENLGYGSRALAKASALKQACRSVGGDFSVLWHNTAAMRSRERRLYEAILDA